MIDGFIVESQFLHQQWFYRKDNVYVMVDPLRGMVNVWERKDGKDTPHALSLSTINKLMEDAKGKIKWN